MKLTNTRITTLILMLSAVVFLALSGCSSDGDDWIRNTAPVADAGVDQHIKTSSLVTLDGSGSSDADHDLLTYDWSMTSRPDGSSATLSGADTSHPTFTADKDGDYVFELIVNDGRFDSRNDEFVTVTATHVDANAKPVAVASADNLHPKLGDTVTLDGSGSSDTDHDLLTYSWTIQSHPPGSSAALSDTSSSHPTFTPDVDGDYVLKLIVNDGHIDSAPATVTVTATHVDTNAKPVAVASADKLHPKTGELVTLDGSGSSDTDHDLLTYSWTIQSHPPGSSAALSDTSSSHPTFTPDVDGDYVLKLIVNDGHIDSAPATVTVTATHVDTNAKPVAVASADNLHPKTGSLVTLDGSGSSDTDHDPLTYSWSIQSHPSGSSATLSDTSSSHPTFTPDAYGAYVFQLTVNDGQVDSNSDTVTVTAGPNCGLPDAPCIFVTSQRYNGDLKTAGAGADGIDGANKICQKDAADAGLQGTYMAWISTDAPAKPIAERMHHSARPYTLPSGTVVANNWTDLTDGTIDEPFNELATGDHVDLTWLAWTGTQPDATAAQHHCNHYEASSASARGLLGIIRRQSAGWTAFANLDCTKSGALYCVQQPPQP